jgi:hypothetical protein
MPKKAKNAGPPLEPRTLPSRLAAIRRRLRFVVTCRGISWLVALLCGTLLYAGFLDWALHLPALVRAAILVGTLGGAGYLAYRFLLRPLHDKADDLTLSLRIEKVYPGLNDGLASTVQFLEEADKPGLDSPGLRREAVKRALRRAQGCDFGKIIDTRGLRTAGLLMVVACTASVALVLLHPQLAYTAIARLVAPFSGVDWPRQTQLEFPPVRERIGRNEIFEVKGIVRGVLPQTAIVVFKIDGATQIEHVYEIAPGDEPGTGTLTVRLEAGRARNSFTFQVHANDAVPYQSKTIHVSPPPTLTVLDGRPSPLVRLHFPAYTDLPPQDLPDGSGNVEAVAGAVVTLRAAADRPLARAWIEYLPETRYIDLSAFLGPFAGMDCAPLLTVTAGCQCVWDAVPAQLEEDRLRFSVRFRPYVSGMYALHFEDDTGLGNTRLFELRVLPDPAPIITLERPSPSRDILDLLPDADVPLQALVADLRYAVRSVVLDYRCKKADPPRSLPVWDHATAGRAVVSSLFAAAGSPGVRNVPPLRLRLVSVPINRAVSLKQFHHLDGSALKEGDVLTLQLAADDFDDVTLDKEPGRSHEVEIHIISRNALDVILNQEEAKVQQDLVRLEKMQREAKKKVTDTQERLKENRKLQPDDLSRLLDAEQQQQQIRERIGDKQEGLRSEVARILETLKNNKLPRSGTHERMERVQSGLDRLAREELPQIEPRLTNARKEAEIQESDGKEKEHGAPNESAAQEKEKQAKASEQQAAEKEQTAAAVEKQAAATPDNNPKKAELKQQAKEAKQEVAKMRQQARELQRQADALRRGETKDEQIKDSLNEARQHQDEVEKTLGELLQALDPFASTAGIKGEAKSILEEQKRVNQETQKFSEKNPNARGANPEELTESQKAQLEKLKDSQRELEERTDRLLSQMEQVRDARAKNNDTETAQELDNALKQAKESDISGMMQNARHQIQDNQTSKAGDIQRDTIKQLEKLVKDLEDRRSAELDRLAKKLREKQDQLEQLAQEQEKLQKKMREARAIQDAKQREEELKKLARRQKELKEQAEDLARQLSRMRQERAGQAASQAAGQMEQALKQLERGQDADEEQEEALERLDEAQREVERSREETEEELAREQLAKIADEIKRVKERQESLVEEASRLEREVLQEKGWRRRFLQSLGRLADNQKALGEETTALGEKKLTEAQVFARLIKKAGGAMADAGEKMLQRRERAIQEPSDLEPNEQAAKLQRQALRRLDQLLEALKPESGMALRPRGRQGDQPGGEPGGSSGSAGGDGIPPVVQYKLLRAMQSEVNQRTEEFSRQHPDPKKLTEAEQVELQTIRRDQQEVADLLDEISKPAPEGDKP